MCVGARPRSALPLAALSDLQEHSKETEASEVLLGWWWDEEEGRLCSIEKFLGILFLLILD